MLPYDKELKKYARSLRKQMTDAEITLWFKLRRKQLKGYQFYRQKIIKKYIVDFYCPKASLVIEVDGSQHYLKEGIIKDKSRDSQLEKMGLRVMRFSDKEVLQEPDDVLEKIFEYLQNPS